MLKWEVHRDGKLMLRTDDDNCFYSEEVIKQMIAAGYKIYKNGKIYKPTKKIKA